jgi:hypothetical protein
MSELILPNVWAKFDLALRREIVDVRPAEFAVLIVLAESADRPPESATSRGEVADELRRAFGRQAKALVDTLAAAGGREIREFWLNHTVAARISLPPLLAVAGRPEVRQVLLDSPRHVEVVAGH